jgi:2',3'-cyclic-nucleotide 2'-phosphodiesterase (5'-nucleotidase family)
MLSLLHPLATNLTPARGLAFAILALLLPACVEFNECVEDRGGLVGQAAIDLDVREKIVRTQETPIGNLVADSLLVTGKSLCVAGGFPCPVIALQNAGGLREETACGTREQIEAGSVWERDIVDLMPFENELVIVRLTGDDIKLALERSVSQLGRIGEAGAAGYFLQVAGLSYTVDCAGEPQAIAGDQSGIDNVGTRVTDIMLTDAAVPVPLDLAAEYEVALNSFIATGRDGFLSFLLRDINNRVITDGGGAPAPKMVRDQDVARTAEGTIVTDRASVMAYIRASDRVSIPVGRPAEGRININESCYLVGSVVE